jgi:hypothetical protein
MLSSFIFNGDASNTLTRAKTSFTRPSPNFAIRLCWYQRRLGMLGRAIARRRWRPCLHLAYAPPTVCDRFDIKGVTPILPLERIVMTVVASGDGGRR